MDSTKEISKTSEALKFVKQLKIEPFVFLALMSFFLKLIVMTQLIQDKICLNSLGQEQALCTEVTISENTDHEELKDEILTSSNVYNIYSSAIITIPGIGYAMFLGSWSDRFASGRKMMMMAASIGLLIDLTVDLLNSIFFQIPTPYLLLSVIPSAMMGGVFSIFTASYSYVVKNSPPDMMVIRYAIIEILMGVASPIATLLPGQMLDMPTWFIPGRIRNFVGVYTVAICLLVPAIVWLYFAVDEKDDEKQDGAQDPADMELRQGEAAVSKNDVKEPWYEPLKHLIDLQNVKTMWSVISKRRPNNNHIKIWLLITGQILAMFSGMADGAIQYQFVQKHFHWTFKHNANIKALFAVLHISVPLIVVPLFVKVLKMPLPIMGLIGTTFWIAALLVRGVFVTEFGYYLSLVIQIPASISQTASGTYQTTLISPNEIGSIFAFTTCFQAGLPLLGNTVAGIIFNATLNTQPGLIYLFISSCVCLFFGAFVYLELTRPKEKVSE